MRTNNIEDLIREQIIEDLLEEAKGVRTERAKTYDNSFLECYNNFGVEYILGELFNCSKRLQILKKESKEISELNWEKINETLPDLINWAILTGVCLKLEEKKLTKASISEGVVKDPKNEIKEETLLIKLLEIYYKNPEYHSYLMGILKFGPPRDINDYLSLIDGYLVVKDNRYNHISKYLDKNITVCENNHLVTLLYYREYILNNNKHIYYVDEEGRIYE